MQVIEIPWGAWYGDTSKRLTLPDNAEIEIMEIPQRPSLSSVVIHERLNSLLPLIKEKNPKNIVIVIDDLTRPVKLKDLIETLLQILESDKSEQRNIKILIGLGGHRSLNKDDLLKKLGSNCVENYPIFNHSPFEDLIKLPIEWKSTPIEINRHFIEAEFRIVISGLVPHSFAGFSGGAKMLIPGISNLEVVKRTHKSVLMGFMGKLGDIDNNRFRREIENIVRQIGVDYFVGLVINPNREVVSMRCGDIISAHHEAARDAQKYYTMEVQDEEYDMIVLNAYPKDTELLQCENAFIPLQSSSKKLVRDGGLVLVTDACSEGMGHHELFGPGKALYRTPMPKRFLNSYDVAFYSHNVAEEDFEKVFWNGYGFYNEWEPVHKYIEKKFPDKFRVLIFPSASMQLVN